jgi:hypothetical protein
MSQLTFSKSSIPLWSGADGSVDVDVNVTDPSKPIDRTAGNPILKTSFDVKAGDKANFGGNSGSIQLGFNASSSVTLAPIWQNQNAAAPDLDKEFGISAGLDNQTLALTLDVGGKADLSVAGSFHYSVLQVGAELDAGVDGRFVCVRPYPVTESLQLILTDFFDNLALPGTLRQAPGKNELYSLEMGGYLKLGVNASAGYSIQGTKDFAVPNLKLSETYDLSILGKLAVTGQIAGRFSVQVKAGAADGWANVQVFRKRTRDIQFAADIQVNASSKLGGLPQTGKEFLGALLGVNAKNWLNLVDSVVTQAGQIGSVADLKTKLDGLADIFISRYANRAIDTVIDGTPEAQNLLKRLQNVVNSYQNLDGSAIALFDRYYDVATQKADQLVAALGKISGLSSLQQFEGEIDPVVWNVFQQLTNGDPLTAILENPLQAIQKKVDDTLSLVKDQAHSDIRDFIALAKSQFGLDPLFNEIAKFDSVDQLKAQASDEVQHLIQRLTGKLLDSIPPADLQQVFKISKQIADGTADFWKHFDDALTAASSQSFTLELNSAWERSDETTALIDVDINLTDVRGRTFLRAAGVGDFSDILANYNPQVVRLNKGSLTHNLQSSQGVKINIVGWHLNFQYENSFQVLTQSDQQIRPTAGGRLNVFTTINMQAQKKTRRETTKAEEQLNTNFTLRFLAETNNIIDGSKFDKAHQQYLIDVITGTEASYLVSFTDSNTTPEKLEEALDFAKVLGLDSVGATVPALTPMLQLSNGSYGAIDAEYNVVFTPAGLTALFSTPVDGGAIREILKPIVLANYIGQPFLSVVGWMYSNDSVKAVYDAEVNNFVNAGSILASANLRPESPIPGVPPQLHVDTSPDTHFRLLTATLFKIEASLIDSFEGLQGLVMSAKGGNTISPDALAKAVNRFGDVLNEFDNQNLGDNTTFSVIDGLIQRADAGNQVRASALDLTTHVSGAERHAIFQLQP